MAKKILITIGTRPEAIKMAPLFLKFRSAAGAAVRVCLTSQHKEMVAPILGFFGIRPDYDLDLMKENQDLSDLTGRIIRSFSGVLEDFKPDYVFVQGDTTTTMGAALASFYKRIPVCHVEAGLRTYNLYNPFPEEANRQIVTRLAAIHFAPTRNARDNLLREAVPAGRILVTGNTSIDALLAAKGKIRENDPAVSKLKTRIRCSGRERIILVTAHRRENQAKGIAHLCRGLKKLALDHPDIRIIYPVHLNPNVRKVVYPLIGRIRNIILVEPVDYEAFVWLMDRSFMIITDSGGIQEEAPALGKPVLVFRETTERPEALKAGTVKLIGTDTESVIRESERILNNRAVYQKMSRKISPYGDGKACSRIVKFIMSRKLPAGK